MYSVDFCDKNHGSANKQIITELRLNGLKNVVSLIYLNDTHRFTKGISNVLYGIVSVD